MLHMLVAHHGPETCAAVNPEVADIAKAGFRGIGEASEKLGITVQDVWVNMAGHVLYFLIEAPNAHVIHELSRDIHLMDWNTVDVNAVVTVEEALGPLDES